MLDEQEKALLDRLLGKKKIRIIKGGKTGKPNVIRVIRPAKKGPATAVGAGEAGAPAPEAPAPEEPAPEEPASTSTA